MMEQWIQIISNVGFPIAMVAYFALRLEKIIGEQTRAINRLYDYLVANATRFK